MGQSQAHTAAPWPDCQPIEPRADYLLFKTTKLCFDIQQETSNTEIGYVC